jgi:hypothetical protein
VPRVGQSVPSAAAGAANLAYVYLKSTKPVDAVVIADGTRMFEGVLKPKKPQQFTASTVVRVWFSRGGVVETTVNGHDLGTPGIRHQRYEASFTPQDFRETPSPAA